ncbi:hypothetical protein K505DRAFT_89921 [Melanomma pulvis-pyrius CBS 109.77]|uniref:Uncharacterized protein n=1 Tax=Melanomma pulvis-pyrius CBS 109.77 TaxID=1314802 RepID=A0A6A6XQY9_9PLEO|nr:hypothetical protein K505DRAFT_89921 [Melanomma pulvis-pyrius CBS 109.77]
MTWCCTGASAATTAPARAPTTPTTLTTLTTTTQPIVYSDRRRFPRSGRHVGARISERWRPISRRGSPDVHRRRDDIVSAVRRGSHAQHAPPVVAGRAGSRGRATCTGGTVLSAVGTLRVGEAWSRADRARVTRPHLLVAGRSNLAARQHARQPRKTNLEQTAASPASLRRERPHTASACATQCGKQTKLPFQPYTGSTHKRCPRAHSMPISRRRQTQAYR